MDFNNVGGPQFGGRGGERFQLTDDQKAAWEAMRAERKAKWDAMSPEERDAAKAARGHGHGRGGRRGGHGFGDLSALLQQAQQD